jgi:glycosyltransferase involved in cell wall biosynthesis
MRVYLVENTDPFNISCGGIPTYIKNLSDYLRMKEVKTFFIGSVFNKSSGGKGRFNGIINISHKKIGHFRFLLKLFILFPRIKIPTGSIIHVQRADLCLPFILFSRKNKLIWTSHGNQWKAINLKKGKIQGSVFGLLERIAVSKSSCFIVVDKINEAYFRKKYPRHASKIARIPIGIDFEKFIPLNKNTCREKFGFSRDYKIVLYIGRLEKEKNLELLLDGFKIVTEINSNNLLVLVGSGSKENELKNYIIRNNILNVKFLGSLPYEEMPCIINCSDLLVLTSVFEGSPTVIKEALACNVPVVSTNCGDVEDVIQDMENCFIAEFNSYDLAQKINRVLSEDRTFNYRPQLTKYSNVNLFEQLFILYQSMF